MYRYYLYRVNAGAISLESRQFQVASELPAAGEGPPIFSCNEACLYTHLYVIIYMLMYITMYVIYIYIHIYMSFSGVSHIYIHTQHGHSTRYFTIPQNDVGNYVGLQVTFMLAAKLIVLEVGAWCCELVGFRVPKTCQRPQLLCHVAFEYLD